MSLHLYPPMTLGVGDPSSCLCSKPYSYGTPEWLMCLVAVLPPPEAEGQQVKAVLADPRIVATWHPFDRSMKTS